MALRLRTSTARRKGKVYRYHQLVRAIRKDGKPTHEVVAHLGKLTEGEAEAIKTSLQRLKAAKTDELQQVLVDVSKLSAAAALQYLDVHVVHRAWADWGLAGFFDKRLPAGRSKIADSKVVELLVVNRALAPCSKLRVTEWTPRTALPELLDFDVRHLNNTRIQRVLERFNEVIEPLQQWLLRHPRRGERPDSVVYLDLTDTYFEGRGGDMGERNRDKYGALRRHLVRIAMAVDRAGLPLRWQVLRGKRHEASVVPDWLAWMQRCPELANVPLVFDRGLLSAANLATLLDAGQPFVSCLRGPNLADFVDEPMLDAIAEGKNGDCLQPPSLRSLGLEQVDDNLFFHDCGKRQLSDYYDLSEPGVRTIAYFKPALWERGKAANERLRRRIQEHIGQLNDELRAARKSRREDKTRGKVDKLLKHYNLSGEYVVELQRIQLPGKKKPVRSFQVRLQPVPHRTAKRDRNAGWVVVIASPDDTRPAAELIAQYHRKETVEHSFKLIKSVVELRPIRHQTNRKIEAHVALCMLALLLSRDLELRLRANGIRRAIDRAYEQLEPCRLQILRTGTGAHSYRITEQTTEQRELLSALGMADLQDRGGAETITRCRY